MIYFGDPPLMKTPGFISYQRSATISGIFRHGLHNCHLAGDCFDTIGHLKEWEKMGNNLDPGRKKGQICLRIDKDRSIGDRSYWYRAASSYLPSYLLLPLVIFIYLISIHISTCIFYMFRDVLGDQAFPASKLWCFWGQLIWNTKNNAVSQTGLGSESLSSSFYN